ncbi:hypothetical protein [Streptomyces sp. NPDC046985]|uniref:hypothetical protein n=1 Tax=Streptomyces sp. NPDC046985 TaxID=3155377 RepID=UPI0034062057
MSSRLARRSVRLALTVASAAALSVTATACSSSDGGAKSSAGASGADASAGASPVAATGAPDSSAGPAQSGQGGATSGAKSGGGTGGSGSGASGKSGTGGSGKSGGGTGAKGGSGTPDKSGWGQACGTTDLDFSVSSESQAGGYYLITAKAKPGITCFLEGKPASVAFGSAADTQASPSERNTSATIKLSGSVRAYAGVDPKSTKGDDGVQFEQIIVAVTDDEGDPVSLSLPDTAVVEKPVTTNWHATPSAAVPLA